jgi:hypothetical protein
MYNEPLCTKCLHPMNYHTEVIAHLNDMTEIRRCTIGMCLCILQVKAPQEPAAGKNKIAKV